MLIAENVVQLYHKRYVYMEIHEMGVLGVTCAMGVTDAVSSKLCLSRYSRQAALIVEKRRSVEVASRPSLQPDPIFGCLRAESQPSEFRALKAFCCQHCTTPYNIVQHLTTLHSTLQHCPTPYNIVQHLTTLSNTLQHCPTPYNIVQHLTTLSNTLQHCPTPCDYVQHFATQHNNFYSFIGFTRIFYAFLVLANFIPQSFCFMIWAFIKIFPILEI